MDVCGCVDSELAILMRFTNNFELLLIYPTCTSIVRFSRHFLCFNRKQVRQRY